MVQIDDINAVMAVLADASSRLSHLLGQPVEVKLIKPEMPELPASEQSALHLKREALKVEILRTVAAQYMVSVTDIKGAVRKRPLPDARKLTAYLLHEYITRIKDDEIADMLAMDRTTVIHHRQTGSELIYTDKDFGFKFNQVVKKLNAYIQNRSPN